MNPGVAIEDARRRAGLSQATLARRTRTSQSTLSAYENGRKQPSVSTLERLLTATGARLHVLTGQRPVVTPTDAELARVARSLSDVLDLAAALPTRHQPELRFPRLPAGGLP
jgi:transcriptional regulator with XRE-family HTH domain